MVQGIELYHHPGLLLARLEGGLVPVDHVMVVLRPGRRLKDEEEGKRAGGRPVEQNCDEALLLLAMVAGGGGAGDEEDGEAHGDGQAHYQAAVGAVLQVAFFQYHQQFCIFQKLQD